MMQAIATGHLDALHLGRECIRRSTVFETYLPQSSELWDKGYRRFLAAEVALRNSL